MLLKELDPHLPYQSVAVWQLTYMPLRLCRYGADDKVEAWLNNLLCLNAAEHIPPPPPQLPHPSNCELYFVERDTLFSYHKARSQIISGHLADIECTACHHLRLI